MNLDTGLSSLPSHNGWYGLRTTSCDQWSEEYNGLVCTAMRRKCEAGNPVSTASLDSIILLYFHGILVNHQMGVWCALEHYISAELGGQARNTGCVAVNGPKDHPMRRL
jgi:hypothetical protein